MKMPENNAVKSRWHAALAGALALTILPIVKPVNFPINQEEFVSVGSHFQGTQYRGPKLVGKQLSGLHNQVWQLQYARAESQGFDVLVALEQLPVKGRAPKTGYSRNQFGSQWTDIDRNGCDTRNDILKRDLTSVVFKEKTRNCVVSKFDIDSYNHNLYQQIIGFKEFISLHYALSIRRDTPYWKHVTQNITYCPDMLEKKVYANQYANISALSVAKREYNPDMGGIPYIAAGMGLNPLDATRVNFINKLDNQEHINYYNRTRDLWEIHLKYLKRIIKRLPTHYKYLLNNIYS